MHKSSSDKAVIIGAGPAGLTAAMELLRKTNLQPIVLEQLDIPGGLARTVEHNGYRLDIGGHRFFSRYPEICEWWRAFLPVEERPDTEPAQLEMMATRTRRSRIYFEGHFYDYPLRPSVLTLRNLGLLRSLGFATSYAKSLISPIAPVKTLEDFLINRFGRKLYETFFRAYTEKVWGVTCAQISADWGAQRIRGLSMGRAILHFLRKVSGLAGKDGGAADTSLVERFWYPPHGPGQLWQAVADRITQFGGEVHYGLEVTRLHLDGNRVKAVEATNAETGETEYFECAAVFSTMPVRELVTAIPEATSGISPEAREVAANLAYRDFITVGLLAKKLAYPGGLTDTWLYIQDPGVRLGRMQIYNNWSKAMLARPDYIWLGLEYFCAENDELWQMPDDELGRFAAAELARLGLLNIEDLLDTHIIRVRKAYPAYTGVWERFQILRDALDAIGNLYLIGRNGMHRYNNQDHSMLTAFAAVETLLAQDGDKSRIWAIEPEKEG